jgi:hypothetical protein
MEPEDVRNTQHEPAPRARRRALGPEEIIHFDFYWRDWLSDPYIRALSRDERAGLMDVWASTFGTRTPGIMSEEQVRNWAGYVVEEWAIHREHFMACFRIRPDGRWVFERARREAVAIRTRKVRAKTSAKLAAQKRWRGKDINAVRIASTSTSTRESRTNHPRTPSVESPDPTPGVSPLGSGSASVGQLLGTVMGRMALESER